MSHTVSIGASPWPGRDVPYLFAATCSCGFTSGDNAFKWVALMTQQHYLDVGLIARGAPGSLHPDGTPTVGG